MHTPALDAAAVATMRTISDTVADLRAIREQWGDLLTAIAQPPAAVWPPLDNINALLATPADEDAPALGRVPLVLREHPAPANLDALDAAVSVEQALFAACDTIAARVQRSVRRVTARCVTGPQGQAFTFGPALDPDDRDDARRWHLPTNREALLPRATGHVLAVPRPVTAEDAEAHERWGIRQVPGVPARRRQAATTVDVATVGSRAHGLHWAAVWLEGRALGEDVGDLFQPLPLPVLDDLAQVARRARARVERALGRDGRPTTLADPCPWCAGTLTAHTRSGDPAAAVITCSTGEACGAPAVLDHGRRVWSGAGLVGLWAALDAARSSAA
ncbi:hypothetical protein [Streptomyces similanensis]|uniref:Uncharacterized protein n=1 Tax=Streptomyces similanensis TaxID=1274988 RepID=A0ABP9KFD4_9ACTN